MATTQRGNGATPTPLAIVPSGTLVAPTGLPGSSFPEAPTDGQAYLRDGQTMSWVPGLTSNAGPTAPATPAVGDLWFNTTDNTLNVWNGTAWEPVGAPSAGGAATVSNTPPLTPTLGDLWFDTDSGQLFVWYSDPDSSQWVVANSGGGSGAALTAPMAFTFVGKPASNERYNITTAIAISVPASLAGTVVYDSTTATTNAAFAVNRISSGTTTNIGTITITPTSNTSCLLSGSGGALAAGDVLQLVAPATQDPSLADIGITVAATRV
jgi:hypothetical protein